MDGRFDGRGGLATAEIEDEFPYRLLLELAVSDRDTIIELCRYPEGDTRDEFALDALRIGVLALRQARGQLDGEVVRREGERLLEQLQGRLTQHAEFVSERLSGSLKDYFDPHSGRFQERVDRLIRKDGDLELMLRRQVGSEDSELCRTLAAHFGQDSPLMKMLSPEQSTGLLAALGETLSAQLQTQRDQVLGQFSLDNKDGALSRFLAELGDRQGELSTKLHEQIEVVVREFSLDDENSALSRLVRNVERAHRTITSEFSLDGEQSALARLKRELLTLLRDSDESNRRFQEEVKIALEAMAVRRREAERSTRHGIEFEAAAFEQVQAESLRSGDIATHVGDTTGRIKNCKVGDYLVELGPDTAAPGARIVVEAKEKAGFDVAQARGELETARKNRDAQVGLFIFSKKSAPPGFDPLVRYGCDVFVTWDAEDLASDLYVRVGLTLARALCVRTHCAQQVQAADFETLDRAILEIEKRASSLEELEKWTTTIRNNSDKILDKLRITREALTKQADTLSTTLAALKGHIAFSRAES